MVENNIFLDVNGDVNEFRNNILKIFNSIDSAIILIDHETHTILDLNDSASSLIGRKREDVLNKKCFSFICGSCEGGCPVTDDKKQIYKKDTFIFDVNNNKIPILKSVSIIELNDKKILLESITDISKLKNYEKEKDELLLEISIRNGMNEIFLLRNSQTLYNEVLQLFLYTFECKHGLFGYLDRDGILICPSLTNEVFNQCKMSDKSLSFPKESWGGIWGDSITKNETFYSNDEFKVPNGHISIKRAISSPIRFNGIPIGLVMIGNRDKDFTKKDIELFESLVANLSPKLKSKLDEDYRIEQLKIYQTQLEQLVNDRTIALQEAIDDMEIELKKRISTQKKLEKALKEVELANQSKTIFFNNMSHELKTPLNAIIGFSEILIDSSDENSFIENKELLSHIQLSGKQLEEMIGNILEITKIDSGNFELNLIDININTLIGNISKNLDLKIKKKNITLEFSIDPLLDKIEADIDKLQIILQELIDNAIKFSKKGDKIIVDIRLEKDLVIFCVQDEGVGISEEDKSNLFKPFTQLGSHYTKSHQGTGMGLYLIKTLVELHGGKIWLESIKGVGSKFYFSLNNIY